MSSSIRELENYIFWGEPLKVLHAVRACKIPYATINVTNVTIYAYYNVTKRYAYYKVSYNVIR